MQQLTVIFVHEREAERLTGLSRHAIVRAALRGEIAFRKGARGRIEFVTDSVLSYAQQRAADDGRARAETTSPKRWARR